MSMMLETESVLQKHASQSCVETQSAKLNNDVKQRQYLYLAGIGVGHSIAAPAHQHIANTLGKPWTFINQECPTINDVVRLFRASTFAGGVVTMPYKKAIIPYLDELDDLATKLGACNHVCLTPQGRLRGSNTDWIGIKGSLLGATDEGVGKPALIVGAGGACRAAIYALTELDCKLIYIINRDTQEVVDVMSEVKAHDSAPEIVHVTSLGQVDNLLAPFYIVASVPDFEPRTVEEVNVAMILNRFLDLDNEKGVLLDMCYKPRNTRILKKGRSKGWKTVEGTEIIGYQFEEQWKLWMGDDATKKLPIDKAWLILNRAAEASTILNK